MEGEVSKNEEGKGEMQVDTTMGSYNFFVLCTKTLLR